MSSELASGPAPSGHTLGAGVLASALHHCGVRYMFGVVGIPIIEVGTAAQQAGIEFVGFRNEQAASYGASAASYLSGIPQACLSVSGPGVVHSLAGIANAWANCWPMILISGASATPQKGMGAFQESPQIELVKPFVKYAARIDSISRIYFHVSRAFHIARSGRPGPVYLEIPAEIVSEIVPNSALQFPQALPSPPRSLADTRDVSKTIELLRTAKKPLVIVGKGAAWSRAEVEVRQFVELLNIPFLATPMGKGVIPDDHPLSVAAGRSSALAGADVVLLIGARLNWILHFGQAPRFLENVKFIQLDITPEELHVNVRVEVGLIGDARAVCQQLIDGSRNVTFPRWEDWKSSLAKDVAKNNATIARLMSNESIPMSYYRVFKSIREHIPKDAVIVSEGANTMDIGRTILGNILPRHRLDAGTYGTMGVGLGFAIAAAMYYRHDPSKRVICVEGDSAFGFSGLEFEVAARYQLPIVFIIVNNSGIYQGIESPELPHDRFTTDMPVTQLTLGARYEKIADIVDPKDGRGYLVTTPKELEDALKEACSLKIPTIINVMIRKQQERKKQAHGWLTTAKPASKL